MGVSAAAAAAGAAVSSTSGSALCRAPGRSPAFAGRAPCCLSPRLLLCPVEEGFVPGEVS